MLSTKIPKSLHVIQKLVYCVMFIRINDVTNVETRFSHSDFVASYVPEK